MADAGRRVQVDERGIARGLRVAVGHADDDGFLQAEDVAEVVGELAEEGQFRRAGVAEDGGHPQLPQQAHNGFAYGGHRGRIMVEGRRSRKAIVGAGDASLFQRLGWYRLCFILLSMLTMRSTPAM